MEFKPAYPQHNDNVSHNSPFREFVVLLAGVALICVVAFAVSGWLVDTVVQSISPDMEARIFAPVAPGQARSGDQVDAGELALQRMVDELGSCIDVGYPLKVELVASKTANAMALPGGRIIVLSGILNKVRSENGMAFVLAHELAHFKNRDHLSGLGRGIVLTAMMAFLTGSDSGLTRLFTPAVGLSAASYSQARESRADSLALKALVCRYGHAAGATEFFQAMKDEHRGGGISNYFASHPEAVERIGRLEELSTAQGYATGVARELPPSLKQAE
ncbi:MAG: M48 family metallopeptidase [Desulfobulbus sp.]|nr:M48 family metallopeptidase [Desulfobulbus sp.]